ncbi:methylamine utilization protein MauJ [Paraburkholderia bannensis]|uniref:methylamine utilization protein MauJ n=1 Tax=Paraburkholderia bannensis TaxID=765414 RepID=UPI002AC359B2|nr:methylamine utilization protein MauJ [Paraburkholderia bannensis]
MDQRFESLRGYNRLPRGRESRGQALTNEQIVAAIFGLVAVLPNWAGHVCSIIGTLKPVGGKANALGGAATLTEALTNVIANQAVREAIAAVRLSVAETATNSNGLAVITYQQNGVRCYLPFVRSEAVSLLQPGVERKFDVELRNSPVNREVVVTHHFFDQLARKIEVARAYPSPPIGDGSEYDKEDAERERRAKLGVTPSSRFLNIGVDNQITWPHEEKLVEFDRYKFVLMPKTKENVQSIHVDLHANRLNIEEARTLINRFLSLLTWCDDQYAIVQDGWSGNPVPVAVSKRNLAFTTTHSWVFRCDIPESDEVRRALALYREARNAEQNFMTRYAVQSYFKVLEVRYPEGKVIRPWIASTFPLIQSAQDSRNMAALLEACGSEKIEGYLWTACRVAVAHVREKHPSDPDSAQELHRLHNAAGIMLPLARHFIGEELRVSGSPFGEVASDE